MDVESGDGKRETVGGNASDNSLGRGTAAPALPGLDGEGPSADLQPESSHRRGRR